MSWPHKIGTKSKLTIHYEKAFKCTAGCGTWTNRPNQTCNVCLLRAEQGNAAAIKAQARARLDPGQLCDDDGRPVAA